MNHIDSHLKKLVEAGIGLRILIKDFFDDGDGVRMQSENHGTERLALSQNKSVIAESMRGLEKGLNPAKRRS